MTQSVSGCAWIAPCSKNMLARREAVIIHATAIPGRLPLLQATAAYVAAKTTLDVVQLTEEVSPSCRRPVGTRLVMKHRRGSEIMWRCIAADIFAGLSSRRWFGMACYYGVGITAADLKGQNCCRNYHQKKRGLARGLVLSGAGEGNRTLLLGVSFRLKACRYGGFRLIQLLVSSQCVTVISTVFRHLYLHRNIISLGLFSVAFRLIRPLNINLA